MVVAEPHSRAVLSLVCTQLLASRDKDKLVLAVVSWSSGSDTGMMV